MPAANRKHFRLLTVMFLFVACIAVAAQAQVPSSNHVYVLMEENHSYSQVVGNTNMPYLNSLIQQYGLATNYDANSHYSIPNYFWITTGKYVTLNDGNTTVFNVDNIVRELLTAGKTWKAYEESIPSVGYTGPTVEPYESNHNPFAFLSDVANSTQKNNMVPFTQFATDIANNNLPNFGWIGPNGTHNGHNAGLATMDAWLKANLPALLATAPFQAGGDGLLIITFDESIDSDCAPLATCPKLPENGGGGHVATVLIGPNVKKGYKSSTFYQHTNALRTIANALGLSTVPGAAATATPMSDFFGASSGSCTGTGGNQTVTICLPVNNTSATSSSVRISAAATDSKTVSLMQVYVDGVKKYEVKSNALDTTLTLASGKRKVTVQAYDGIYFKSTVYVTVP